jgi:Tfp pilus assembly protein PilX
LAGNLQFENEAKNRAESALIKGENWLLTNTANAGFTATNAPYYAPGTTVTPLTSWPSAAVSPAAGEQYIIQRITLSKVAPSGYSTCLNCPPSAPTPTYDLYSVTARGTSARGATRFVQSIMQAP